MKTLTMTGTIATIIGGQVTEMNPYILGTLQHSLR